MWPRGGKYPRTRCQVEEGYRWRMEVDIESVLVATSLAVVAQRKPSAYLDPGKNRSLVHIVITCVDDTFGQRPSLLGCSDGGPEDSFTSSSSITEAVSYRFLQDLDRESYQKGWKNPTMPSHSVSAFSPVPAVPVA